MTYSKFAAKYEAPVPLQKMATSMRASRAGVVVLSCSDPRLNPYQILGIDPTLSMDMLILVSFETNFEL